MTETQNVYQCIAKASAEIAQTGISKDRKNAQQGYSFRGIDDVYNALAPIISKNGLVILPRVLSRSVVERQTKSGGVMFYTTVESEFDFVSMHDQSKHTVKTYGEAMDSGDKSTNKAMSAAYKYACMQAFCIPTEGDNDADAHTHEPLPDKFTPEHKSLQSDLLTKVAIAKDKHDMQSVIDGIAADLATLPVQMQELVNQEIENRLNGFENNVAFPPAKHKFAGVNDAIAWTIKMKPVTEGFKSTKALIDWQTYNQPWIDALDILKAEKYKKDDKYPKERFTDALKSKYDELSNLELSQQPLAAE